MDVTAGSRVCDRRRFGLDIMSVKVTRKAWRATVPTLGSRVVLLALADFADDAGVCWPSIDTIADKCGMSGRSVRRSLADLSDAGLVVVRRRPNSSNEYVVTPDTASAQMDDSESESEAPRGDTASGVGVTVRPPLNPVRGDTASGGRGDTVGLTKRLLGNEPSIRDSRRSDDPLPPRDDVEQLCTTLVQAMVANGCRKPTITQRWRDDMRLLLDRDEVPLATALAVLAWSQADEFWKANIQSPRKFRAKFDTLRLQMQRFGVKPASDEASINDWLRECWTNHDTAAVTNRCGLEFHLPDIPEHVTDVRGFTFQARRDWIKTHHDEILERILRREAS